MSKNKIKAWLPAIRTGSGSEVFTKRLADALRRQGMEAEITWFAPSYEPLPFLLRTAQPPHGTNIVFANSWNGFAFKKAGIPLVVTVHHSGFSEEVAAYRSMAQRLYHRALITPFELRSVNAANAVAAVSQYAANALRPHTGLDKIHVIHNWIDTDLFYPLKNIGSRPDRPFRLLFIGKPTFLKGADLLAPLMNRLGQAFELNIATKYCPSALKDSIPNLRLLGWLEGAKLIQAYQECDALLFPSRAEGFGYVALEAMSCGKPVIAADSTAIPEVVKHHETGLLCRTGDVNAFVEACRELKNDPGLHSRLGLTARKHAVENFSETTIIKEYVKLIYQVMGLGGPQDHELC